MKRFDLRHLRDEPNSVVLERMGAILDSSVSGGSGDLYV
ncbi:NADH-ubiquinone oxidoreductase subunit E family protein [Helicobacter heilmannii]